MIEPGASVRAGQTVAVLSSTEFQDLQLDCLQANLELKFRESVLANIRQAGSNVPQRQRLESESLVVSARNRLENAVRQLQLLGIAQKSIESMLQSQQILEYFPVQSPIDGIVVGFNKAIGHIVSADEELLEVHDTSERLVEAFVSEIDAGSIRQGQTLRCRTVAEEHRSYPGKVLSSSQSLSNRGQTLSIWAKVEFDQDSMIYHNMLCRLAIQIPESDSNGDSNANAQVVPLSSILKEGSQSFVFVALTDGSYQRQRVTLGRSDGTEVAILSGLQSGDVVVVQGVSALQTGYAAIQ
jgi:RND family efflux transporter MFP subunit